MGLVCHFLRMRLVRLEHAPCCHLLRMHVMFRACSVLSLLEHSCYAQSMDLVVTYCACAFCACILSLVCAPCFHLRRNHLMSLIAHALCCHLLHACALSCHLLHMCLVATYCACASETLLAHALVCHLLRSIRKCAKSTTRAL
jgi:hypothetical protein